MAPQIYALVAQPHGCSGPELSQPRKLFVQCGTEYIWLHNIFMSVDLSSHGTSAIIVTIEVTYWAAPVEWKLYVRMECVWFPVSVWTSITVIIGTKVRKLDPTTGWGFTSETWVVLTLIWNWLFKGSAQFLGSSFSDILHFMGRKTLDSRCPTFVVLVRLKLLWSFVNTSEYVVSRRQGGPITFSGVIEVPWLEHFPPLLSYVVLAW